MTDIGCPNCRSGIPAGEFCGSCGIRSRPAGDNPVRSRPAGDDPVQSRPAGDNPVQSRPASRLGWLRPDAFVTAPRENLLWPALTSTLFPRLPRRSRIRFRIVLIVLVTVVLGLAGLQLAAALIAVGALWLLVLLLLYLHESGAAHRISRGCLATTGILGALLGVGWMVLSAEVISRAYDIPIATGLAVRHLFREGVLMPAGALILMGLPAIVARLRWRGARESLDGFTIGALGAASFNAAATLTRYAPQFATGLLHRDRPTLGLVVEAGINGIALPLTGAVTGGLIGVVLWFSTSGDHPRARRVRWYLIALAGTTLGIFFVERIIDIHGAPETPTLTVHAALTCVALLAARLGVQLALLTEPHVLTPTKPTLCVQCEHVVSGQVFCSDCGAVLCYPAPAQVRPPSILRMAVPLTTIVVLALTVLFVSSELVPQKTPFYQCPPDCGQPPMGTPVAINPRFTAPNGEFSVSYPAPNSAYRITTRDNGVTAELTIGDTGILQLFAKPANGSSAPEIVKDIVQSRFPGAQVAYVIPNAMVGYESGYGEVADAWPVSGTYPRVRIVVLAAIKNDLALIAAAAGPYHPYGPDFGPGKPTGTNLQIALDMGKYVNSFSWKGDPPR